MVSIQIQKGYMIGIGNPILDISNDTTEESIKKYGLAWGQTIFANDDNMGFFDELEKTPNCQYVPGGSVTNSIRVTNWMFKDKGFFKTGLIGCIGNDDYGKTIKNELTKAGVSTDFVEVTDTELSSRCGCGIYKKDRCLMPQIRASNKLNKSFVEKNLSAILQADILFVEGYFLIECWDIVQYLVKQFKDAKKKVAFTLSAVFMVQFHWDKIKALADVADIIFGNEDETKAFVEKLGKTTASDKENTETLGKELAKDKIIVSTCGKNPVIIVDTTYNKTFSVDVTPIKEEEIVDTNGCGDAFVGGFMSEYLAGKDIDTCGRAGNYASSVIIRNIGCTFPSKPDFKSK